MELAKVGILLRGDEQGYPLQEITELFGRHGIELAELEWNTDPPIDLDLVMAMGGDGTALKALDLCPLCPVLAVNYGTVGFLTAGDRADLESILAHLVKGEFLVSERIALECQYPTGCVRAVNEVIVRTYNRLMFTDVSVDDIEIRTIRGDGVGHA